MAAVRSDFEPRDRSKSPQKRGKRAMSAERAVAGYSNNLWQIANCYLPTAHSWLTT